MARRSSSLGGWIACCLAFVLKFLAFLQAFAAVSALLYAAWILSRWARQHRLHLHDLLSDLWFPSVVMAAGLFYSLLLLAGTLSRPWRCCCSKLLLPPISYSTGTGSRICHMTAPGEVDNLLSFINHNLDLCKWVALAVFAPQALSLFLAMFLRAMLSARSIDYDSDEDFVVIRRPLLVAQATPYLPTTVDARGFRPYLWSSRMRQKGISPLMHIIL